MKLRNLMDLLNSFSLSSRPLRLEIAHLENLQVPAILHWDLDHFVVLKKFRGGRAEIYDPNDGVKLYSTPELSKRFTGVALEISKASEFTNVAEISKVQWRLLAPISLSLIKNLTFIFLLTLAVQAAAIFMPLQMQLIIDDVIGKGRNGLLNAIAATFVFLAIFQYFLQFSRDYISQEIGRKVTFQILTNIVKHLFRLPIDYFEKRHASDIVSRLSSAKSIQDVLTGGVIGGVIDVFSLITSVCFMLYYSVELAALTIVFTAIMMTFHIFFLQILRRRNAEMVEAAAREQSFMMESVRAIKTIKIMNGESDREARWKNAYSKALNLGLRADHYRSLSNGIWSILLATQLSATLYFGARMVVNPGTLSLGMFTAFLAFSQTFLIKTKSIADYCGQSFLLAVHIHRLNDILGQEPETYAFEEMADIGTFELRNVSFRYSNGGNWILRNVDLTVGSGEFLAVVGKSGAGKTTLLKLMLGILEPTEGQILLNGLPASTAMWRTWRRNLGVVGQEDALLSGSLFDNISFFDQQPDADKVEEVCRLANLYDDIDAMPMRFQTLVGDMGSSLSSGQKQRILLARALYRSPNILFLDEGTANLDPQTEDRIAQVISNLTITRVVIAHKPRLVRSATRVIKVDEAAICIVEPASISENSLFGGSKTPFSAPID